MNGSARRLRGMGGNCVTGNMIIDSNVGRSTAGCPYRKAFDKRSSALILSSQRWPANLGIKFCHLSERQTLMKLQAALVVLVMLSLPAISEEAKPARLGVTRGYGLGSLWAEIQIDRTVYVSRDYCEAAGLIGSYAAEVRKNTVRLHVGKRICKYHILYDRPALKRGVRNKEASGSSR
jgi:hypothetical protein